jgi:hypothetical protein
VLSALGPEANKDLATKTEILKGWTYKMATKLKDRNSSKPPTQTLEMYEKFEEDNEMVCFDGFSEVQFKDDDSEGPSMSAGAKLDHSAPRERRSAAA